MTSTPDESGPAEIGRLDHNGRAFVVTCQVVFDGIEHIGRLWFAEDGSADGIPDRASIPGSSRDAVLESARRLSEHDLMLRHRRALAEKRRYHGLRELTDEILSSIRYLNQVVVSSRSGMLDPEGASQEIDLAARLLHTCVDRIKEQAGVESGS